MTSPVFSKRFIAVTALATNAQAVVPAGKVWILTHWAATCSTDNTLGYFLVHAPYPVLVAYYTEQSTTNHVSRYQETRIVLYAGETLRFDAIATKWDAVASGYELTAAG